MALAGESVAPAGLQQCYCHHCPGRGWPTVNSQSLRLASLNGSPVGVNRGPESRARSKVDHKKTVGNACFAAVQSGCLLSCRMLGGRRDARRWCYCELLSAACRRCASSLAASSSCCLTRASVLNAALACSVSEAPPAAAETAVSPRPQAASVRHAMNARITRCIS